ncbi:hypothetical protein [Nocardia asteroides]|uniref:hypothetical protein n=1 Tax=Nocardia asteroides TaxID=1824 RepID=UPI001E62A386|nr:hypothetical protein [Nocardia asteroides]UGT59263.1 hypothetical protein LTT61_18455 [Nocardia asteroides]
MSEIEYVFGTGDGVVHGWSSPADLALGGALDAVRLDFDGDGLLDDALWDADRDGIAELSALDLTDDGVLDHFYTDPTGLGTWDHQVTGVPEDAAAEPLGWTVRGEADGRATAPASAGPDISWPPGPCLLAPQAEPRPAPGGR